MYSSRKNILWLVLEPFMQGHFEFSNSGEFVSSVSVQVARKVKISRRCAYRAREHFKPDLFHQLQDRTTCIRAGVVIL
jgi:hypothetical protein